MYNVGAMINYPKDPAQVGRLKDSLPDYCLDLVEQEELPPPNDGGAGGADVLPDAGDEDPAPDVTDPIRGCNCDIVGPPSSNSGFGPWAILILLGFGIVGLIVFRRINVVRSNKIGEMED
jgi:hypothetical protein